MDFYEVYRSPDKGVVEGNIGAWISTGCAGAIALPLAAVLRKGKDKEDKCQEPAERVDIFR